MRVGFLLAIAMSVSGCQLTQSPEKAGSVDNEDEIVTDWGTYPSAQAVSFSDVLALRYDKPSATLQYGNEPLQFGKLWLPDGRSTPPPLVIFVHGGCWLSDYDIVHSYALATALKQAGFAVWAVEYRRTGDPGGGWPGSLEDVVRAIDFIYTQAQIKFYPERVTLIGHSAGGHLAMLAVQASDRNIEQTIGLAPIIDIEKYAMGKNSCQRATIDFMGGTPEQRPSQYRSASLAGAQFQQEMTILTGDKDSIVPLPENPLPAVPFISVNNAGHFDWLHPGTPAFAAFIEQLENK